MSRSFTPVLLVAFALAAMAVGATPAAVDSCSNLIGNGSLQSLPNTTITSATTVSGTFTPPGGGPIQGLPSFCRVAATLKPSPVSNVKIEVWLPTGGWNQKLQAVGNGGLAGTISYAALAIAIKGGFASVSTDTGHIASDITWLPDEEKEKDYGYRAIHGMTVFAKTVAQQFYGSAVKRSYFNGCSTGGGQGFGEVQLYPEDYDGVLAGAPQNYATRLRAAGIWEFQVASNDPASKLAKATLSLVTAAVLRECGGRWSVDGFLGDPQACRFDPKELICKWDQDPAACLTVAQVSAVQKIYAGAVNPKTKKQIWPGLLPGSEAPAGTGAVGWEAAAFTGQTPFAPPAQFYSMGVFENPKLDFHTVDIDSAIQSAERKFPFINHTSTEIDAFTKRGGKLLMYHGWADPNISPLNTINYYGSLVKATQSKSLLDNAGAQKETQKSVLLFMVPGMGHCSGGPGPDTFDGIGVLDEWVDHGVAPDKIIASHLTNGVPTMSRPLCPYPQQARYTGSGDRTNASNWACTDGPFIFDPSFYK
jgi:feruloyl esterase